MSKLVPLQRRVAFTMVEVTIAIGIFGLMLLGTHSVVNAQWQIIRKTQERIYVSHILKSRLEEIRDLTFEELEALPAEIDFSVQPAVTVFGKTVNPDLVSTDYQRTLRESIGTVYIVTIETDMKQVSVEIAWKPGSASKSVNMVMTTYITRNGINRQ